MRSKASLLDTALLGRGVKPPNGLWVWLCLQLKTHSHTQFVTTFDATHIYKCHCFLQVHWSCEYFLFLFLHFQSFPVLVLLDSASVSSSPGLYFFEAEAKQFRLNSMFKINMNQWFNFLSKRNHHMWLVHPKYPQMKILDSPVPECLCGILPEMLSDPVRLDFFQKLLQVLIWGFVVFFVGVWGFCKPAYDTNRKNSTN